MPIDIDGILYCKVFGPLLFIFCLFLGMLNLPVLWAHLKKKSSPEKHLFVLLSISNLVITWPLGLIEAVNMMILVMNNSALINIYADRGKSAIAVILVMIGCNSQILAAFLSITRGIKIYNPFRVLKKRFLLTTVAITNVFVSINFLVIFYYLVLSEHYGSSTERVQSTTSNNKSSYDLNNVITLPATIGYCVTFCLTITGNIFSTFSIVYLYHYSNQQFPQSRINSASSLRRKGENQRSVNTLFLMNIPYMFQLIISAIYLDSLNVNKRNFDLMRELNYIVGPILTSCFNPVILLYRNKEYRDLVLATGQNLYKCFRQHARQSGLEITRAQNNVTAPTSVGN